MLVLKGLAVIVHSKLHFFPNPPIFFCIFRENFTVITYLYNNSLRNSILRLGTSASLYKISTVKCAKRSIFSYRGQECAKCVLTSLTRKISMQCLWKHSHGVLHRVPRFIELSLYLPFNIYACGMECIAPLPFTLGWHLVMDKIYFLYLWWSSEHYSVALVVCLGPFRKQIVQ